MRRVMHFIDPELKELLQELVYRRPTSSVMIILDAIQELRNFMATRTEQLDAGLADAAANIALLTSASNSAVALINTFGDKLDAAIQEARDNGVQDEDLTALTSLSKAIKNNASSLADAVAANTTPEPPPPGDDTTSAPADVSEGVTSNPDEI